MNIDKFNVKWTPEPYSGCWLWTGGTNGRYGYGWINELGKSELAHRVSWTLHRGPIPNGMQVLHRCDTPACVNPEHLFLGTRSDNMRDSFAKGRRNLPKGSKHHRAKLSESQVREIRSSSETHTTIAKRFGISYSHAYTIRTHRRWKHL